MRNKNSQGRRTKEQIIQAAITAFAEKGAHGVSLQDVSRKLKIKRSHLVYHFKDTDELFHATWKSVYEKALQTTEERLIGAGTNTQKLAEYFKVSIDFFTSNSEFTKLYFQLHYMSVFSDQLRVINTAVKQRAVQRLAKIIMNGQLAGEFKQGIDPYLHAKSLHSGLVGILLNSISEFPQFSLNEILEAYTNTILAGLK